MEGNVTNEKPIVDGVVEQPEVEITKQPEIDIKKAKKQFFVVAIVASVLIVGLIISIIVVVVNKKPSDSPQVPQESAENSPASEEKEGFILNDTELYAAYNEVADEISQATLTASENGGGMDGVLQFIQEKINVAEDARLKAMLETDYYYLRFSLSPTDELKNEILNALMRIDGVLKSSASAYSVVNIASYYNEQEIVNHYTNLAMERGETEVDGTEETDEELEGVG